MTIVHPESMWPESIRCFDVTLPTFEENLSLDEVLLSDVDSDPTTACIRFWEPSNYGVILGRSNVAGNEVHVERCAGDGIPILRRHSGGGAVLIGPHCLCYAIVLPITNSIRTLGISPVTKELMWRTASGLSQQVSDVEVSGISDLVHCGKKFSGNAQRWLKNAFIHQGTLLASFDLPQIDRYLRHPSREPQYRNSRGHIDFVTNLGLEISKLKEALRSTWNGKSVECPAAVLESASRTASTRYCSPEWMISSGH